MMSSHRMAQQVYEDLCCAIYRLRAGTSVQLSVALTIHASVSTNRCSEAVNECDARLLRLLKLQHPCVCASV